MNQKLRLFTIHQTAKSLQRIDNLNPRTRLYPAQDESNKMKSAYFTIHPGKNLPPQNACRLKSVFFSKAPVSHPPFSQFPNSTGLFTKPTSCHYTNYRFSLDIDWAFLRPRDVMDQLANIIFASIVCDAL
jgi:hypothetical protein